MLSTACSITIGAGLPSSRYRAPDGGASLRRCLFAGPLLAAITRATNAVDDSATPSAPTHRETGRQCSLLAPGRWGDRDAPD
ncbi:hypothetical protein MTO96_009818 [Rhipicephalus appendiculatus]